MSEYKTVGAVVSPGRTFEAIFYNKEKKEKIRRYPVVALEILVKEDKKEGNSTMTQPLCWVEEWGNVFSMQDIGYCFGMEMDGKKRDWSEEVKEFEKFEEENK